MGGSAGVPVFQTRCLEICPRSGMSHMSLTATLSSHVPATLRRHLLPKC